MAIIKIETIELKDIREYANNPRKIKRAIEPVKRSIKKFGYTNPIIINKDNVILAGHTRLEALRKTGAVKAEVIRLTHLTEEQEKAFRIADNRTSEFAEWDKDLLEVEMREINADDWKEFGFDEKTIERVATPNMCTCPKCGKQFMKI